MELRQNWHKLQRILGPLPAKKPGMLVLHSHNRVLAGTLGHSAQSPSNSGFTDVGREIDPIDTTWELFAHKYNSVGATFIDNEELMGALSQVAAVRPTAPATDHFHAQLTKLRELMGVDKGEKSKLATHMGERPVEHFWPRRNFMLSLFKSFFGELFPERKLLLLAVVNDAQSIDALGRVPGSANQSGRARRLETFAEDSRPARCGKRSAFRAAALAHEGTAALALLKGLTEAKPLPAGGVAAAAFVSAIRWALHAIFRAGRLHFRSSLEELLAQINQSFLALFGSDRQRTSAAFYGQNPDAVGGSRHSAAPFIAGAKPLHAARKTSGGQHAPEIPGPATVFGFFKLRRARELVVLYFYRELFLVSIGAS
ncbi:MAG: hypothetical protein EOP11_09435 [Proteobacteria bacterium]|nr:MAG: hypothetical protein EOP11_09435 [Pseudomonadota bacterium]